MNRIVICLCFLVSALGAWSGLQAQALMPAQPLDRIVAPAAARDLLSDPNRP